MLKPSQIIAIFGVFLSMFYIFKYAGTNPGYAKILCQELMGLQIDAVAVIRPLIQADTSDQSFENKLQGAMKMLETNTDFAEQQDRIIKIQTQLQGRACPAPNLAQMTRLVVGAI